MNKLFSEERKEWKKSEIIASSFNYANPTEVNLVFSRLLDINFLSAIKKWSEENWRDYYYEDVHIFNTTPLHKNWNNFMNIFELRDGIVHKGKDAEFKRLKDVRNIVENTTNFLVTSDLLINSPRVRDFYRKIS